MSSSWHLSIPSALKTVAHFVSSNVWIMQNNQYYKIERITTFYTYIGGHWNTGCKNLPLSLLTKYIVIEPQDLVDLRFKRQVVLAIKMFIIVMFIPSGATMLWICTWTEFCFLHVWLCIVLTNILMQNYFTSHFKKHKWLDIIM